MRDARQGYSWQWAGERDFEDARRHIADGNGMRMVQQPLRVYQVSLSSSSWRCSQ